MFPIRKIFILLSCIAFAYPQSLINSFGMGIPGLYRDVASSGLSSSGLVPGYGKNLSLMNPSTWPSSKFVLFSSTFKGATRLFNQENIENQHSNIDWLIFIVPIKQKYAFGIGLFPYADQNIQFNREDLIYPDNEEFVSYSGGLTSFRLAFGFPLGNFGSGGWGFDLLFGSTRVHKFTDINEEIYIHDQRKMFNGVISQLYFTSNPFFIQSKEMIFYLNLGFTLRDFSAEVQSYQPFIDRNHNGIHDVSYYENIPSNNDFPGTNNSPDPLLTQFQGFYNPIELTLGVNVKYSSNISLVCESGLWNNDSNISDKLFDFSDGLNSKLFFSQALIKYAKVFPQNIFDRFHWRIGYNISQLKFDNNLKQIDKYDLSVGFGLPFGKFGSQIDFSFKISDLYDDLKTCKQRSGEPLVCVNKGGYLINESVQTIKIGLTIGDIWFVKRRNR